APPDDAPTENSVFHGLRVGSRRAYSVLALSPNSGRVLLQSTVNPALSSCLATRPCRAAGRGRYASVPFPVGMPATSVLSLTKNGTPDNSPGAGFAAASTACSNAANSTALSAGFTFSTRATAASATSTGLSSRRRISSASATASCSPRASSANACTLVSVIGELLRRLYESGLSVTDPPSGNPASTYGGKR